MRTGGGIGLNTILIIIRSATVGMQIRDALRHGGISARLVRVPREYTDGSCTQAVEISSIDKGSAEFILRRAGIHDFRFR